tara:strand:- start:1106 stop:1405 length:300 start_codon:yes stop_codon:yes gene_type:complete
MSKSDYRTRRAGKPPIQYVFTGNHERLVTGATYTIPEMAIIVGINDKTMHSRMRGKCEFTNKEVRPKNSEGPNFKRPGLYERLETKDMKLSDKWMRIKL